MLSVRGEVCREFNAFYSMTLAQKQNSFSIGAHFQSQPAW